MVCTAVRGKFCRLLWGSSHWFGFIICGPFTSFTVPWVTVIVQGVTFARTSSKERKEPHRMRRGSIGGNKPNKKPKKNPDFTDPSGTQVNIRSDPEGSYTYTTNDGRGDFVHNHWSESFPNRKPETPEFKELYDWCQTNRPHNVLVFGLGLGLIIDVLLGGSFRTAGQPDHPMHLTLLDPVEESVQLVKALVQTNPEIEKRVTLHVTTAQAFLQSAARPTPPYDLVFDDAWSSTGKIWLFTQPILQEVRRLMKPEGHFVVHCRNTMVPSMTNAFTTVGFQPVLGKRSSGGQVRCAGQCDTMLQYYVLKTNVTEDTSLNAAYYQGNLRSWG